MNITPKKSLGQHWLFDSAALDEMCEAAEVTAGDTVLEIGPGLGTLTEILLEYQAKVVAVEFDKQLYDKLQRNDFYSKDAKNLTLINQDILAFDFSSMPSDYKIAANIPYYVTAQLLRILTETKFKPTVAALLVQKEVAERLAARPGQLSIIAVATQLFYNVKLGIEVPAELFTPPPKVDSQIVILKRRVKPLLEELNTKKYFQIVKAGFSQKRKKLRSSLSAGLRMEKSVLDELLQKATIDGNLRAQDLSLEDWYKIYQAL